MHSPCASASLLPGQGGLEVLRLDVTYVGETPTDRGSLAFTDTNYDGHVGWHEVTATGMDGVPEAGPNRAGEHLLAMFPSQPLGRLVKYIYRAAVALLGRARRGTEHVRGQPELFSRYGR